MMVVLRRFSLIGRLLINNQRVNKLSVYPVRCYLTCSANNHCSLFKSHNLTSWIIQRKHSISCSTKIDATQFADYLLESKYMEVQGFGSIKCTSSVPTIIERLDTNNYPEQNRVFIYVLHQDATEAKSKVSTEKLDHLSNIHTLETKFNEDKSHLDIRLSLPDGVILPLVCLIQMPLKSNLVSENHADLVLRDTENRHINIKMEKGSCFLYNVKSGETLVDCKEGNIVSEKVLQGDIELSAENGDIQTDRLQGNYVKCHCGTGNISVKSVYAETSQFNVVQGDISLKNCHGGTIIAAEKGNVTVDGADGDLNVLVGYGDVSAYIPRHNNVLISTKQGNISVKLPEDCDTKLEAKSRKIDLSKIASCFKSENEIAHGDMKQITGKLGDGSSNLKLEAQQGDIIIDKQDWLNSIGFKSIR